VSSYEFKEFFLGYFADKVSSETLLSIDWEGWFNTPGMPIQKPKFDTTLAEASENLAKQWLAGGADVSIDGWTAKQICMRSDCFNISGFVLVFF
jgi:leukotriene-A4 hydrolase